MVPVRIAALICVMVGVSGCVMLGNGDLIYFDHKADQTSEDTSGCDLSEDSEIDDGDGALGCGNGFIDYGCDNDLGPCPDGTHRDFDPDKACSVCAEDTETPMTCDEAQTRYAAFLEHVIPSSCADYCDDADDCFVSEISNACAVDRVALYGGIDEEIIEIADQFARDNCAPECGAAPSDSKLVRDAPVACVDHRCRLR